MMPEMHNPETAVPAPSRITHPVSLAIAEVAVPEAAVYGWWQRVRLGKIGLFVASLYLFVLAITLMKEGARAVAPLVSSLLDVQGAANALGSAGCSPTPS
jgi:hypothetical protein